MTVNEVMKYVMNTPENTNPAVLKGMLEQLSNGGGTGHTLTVTPNSFEVPLNEEDGNITFGPVIIKYDNEIIDSSLLGIIAYVPGFILDDIVYSDYWTGSYDQLFIEDNQIHFMMPDSRMNYILYILYNGLYTTINLTLTLPPADYYWPINESEFNQEVTAWTGHGMGPADGSGPYNDSSVYMPGNYNFTGWYTISDLGDGWYARYSNMSSPK